MKKINKALISVYSKIGLESVLKTLKSFNISLISTGGTEKFIKDLGYKVEGVENLTGYPSILDGRVKTLHPKIFGGILAKTNSKENLKEISLHQIPLIDLLIVDLYPFEETVLSDAHHNEIIEKIDIGGISLIRAAAKNFKDVLCISNKSDYKKLNEILINNNGCSNLEERKKFARKAFDVSSKYDSEIFKYFDEDNSSLKINISRANKLRYGENPHQKGIFYGSIEDSFEQLNGKKVSYNNLIDIDSAVNLMSEFNSKNSVFGIFKHNNACGFSSKDSTKKSFLSSLSSDPISAFGGVLISNKKIDYETSLELNKLFFEIIIAPSFDNDSLNLLKTKKNRIILKQKNILLQSETIRSCLNGYLFQDRDIITDSESNFKYVTKVKPSKNEINDLIFASKISKHTKSNTIVIVKDLQLLSSGTGQTSRVDALNQAIQKAIKFGFSLNGAVMASDAFFPFPDCIEIANNHKITSVIQPGGSIKDNLSINLCNTNKMSMVFTGIRHFKH
tara:strand:+ start:45110 stop:46627 length:1518 start_codon:yes stop_codon:yes gene_type:complete